MQLFYLFKAVHKLFSNLSSLLDSLEITILLMILIS